MGLGIYLEANGRSAGKNTPPSFAEPECPSQFQNCPFHGEIDYTVHCGTAVAQWLRCCATNRKVAGSIPAGVIGFFIDIKSFLSHYGPGVDSASTVFTTAHKSSHYSSNGKTYDIV